MPKIEYIISTKDNASPEINQLMEKMKQLGAVVDENSKKENGLAAYRKAQNAEMKNYKFVVNDVKDAIGGLAIGMGFLGANSADANSTVKSLSNSVNAGFAGFSAMDAVTGALGTKFAALAGPMGLAISLGGALAGILANLASESKNADIEFDKLNASLVEMQYNTGQVSKDVYLASLTKQLAEAQIALEKTKTVSIDWRKSLSSVLTGTAILSVGVDANDVKSGEKKVSELQGKINAILRNSGKETGDIDNATTALILSNNEKRLFATTTDEVSRMRISYEASISRLNQQQKETLASETNEDKRTLIIKQYDQKREALRLDYNGKISQYAKDLDKSLRDLETESKNNIINSEIQKNAITATSAKQRIDQVEYEYKKKKEIIENNRTNALADNPSNADLINRTYDNQQIALKQDTANKKIQIEQESAMKIKDILENNVIAIVDIGVTLNTQYEESAVKVLEIKKKASMDALALEEKSYDNAIMNEEQRTRLTASYVAKRAAIEAMYDEKIVAAKKTNADIIKQLQLDSITDTVQKLKAQEAEELAKADRELAGVEQLEAAKDLIRKKYETLRTNAMNEDTKKYLNIMLHTASKIGREIMTNNSNISQARIDQIETEKEDALSSIDAQLESNTLSEAQRTNLLNQRKTLETEYNTKVRQEKERAWKAEKEAKLIMAAIDTASAMIEAAPNWFQVAAVAVLGAAQMAVINSQPTPKFHTGGVIGQPPLQPNERLIVGQVGETIRTQQQERELYRSNSGGSTVVVNINSAFTDVQAVKKAVEKGLRATNQTVDKYFVNNSKNLVIS